MCHFATFWRHLCHLKFPRHRTIKHRRSPSSERPSIYVLSLVVSLSLSTALPPPSTGFFIFCTVQFPQLLRLLHLEPWQGKTIHLLVWLADALLFVPYVMQHSFISGEKIEPGGRPCRTVKDNPIGIQSMCGCCHLAAKTVFTSERYVKVEQLSIASLRKKDRKWISIFHTNVKWFL